MDFRKRMMYLILLCSVSLSNAAVYTVTNTQNNGEGSLRHAISETNDRIGPDTIIFRIPKSDPGYDNKKGYWTIALRSTMTTITDDSLTIDGWSQREIKPNAPAGTPLVVLSGYSIPGSTHGLLLFSSYNTIQGLCIGGFQGAHIWIKSSFAHNNRIKGCYLGLFPDGQTGMFDASSPQFAVYESEGIYISAGSCDNLIGGMENNARNIICNMYLEAIRVEQSHHNTIQGNYIGITKNGVIPLGNGWIDVPRYEIENRKLRRFPGIHIYIGSHHNTVGGTSAGARNVICASGRAGIRIEHEGSDENVVQGNYLGVGADGEYHENCGNGEAGLKLQRGTRYNIIGGTQSGAGNVVSANGSSGIQIREGSNHNTIAGNLIGTNAKGDKRVPNAHNGIYTFGEKREGYPHHNDIGPNNVIIVNGQESIGEPFTTTWAAVRMDSVGTHSNRVFGNTLGTNRNGNLDSDHNSGVIIGGGAHNNTIGPDNVIAHTRKYGVWIRQSGTIHNTITANSIHDHQLGSIYLQEGGNENIDPPVNVLSGPGRVSGTCVPFGKVELYLDNGMTFVDSVYANAQGKFIWNGPAQEATYFATVTDPRGNTSRFSSSTSVPVELGSFFAEKLSYGIRLRWETVSETNNLGFAVERKESDFVEIGFIGGAGTTVEPQSYSYIDGNPGGLNQVYRLKQMDFDGTTTCSDTITVRLQPPGSIELSPPQPNPSNGMTAFTIDLPSASSLDVTIFNIQGEKVSTIYHGTKSAGSHRFVWDGINVSGRRVSSGVYFIQISAENTTLNRKVLFIK